MALLSVLVRLGYACVALHCDFHLRGEESERDAAFARTFAESLGVPFYQTDFDTVAYAREHHLSIEMAARALRYAWFEELRERLGAQAIAVAHHRDDSVETVVMNLIRGTGIDGLAGVLADEYKDTYSFGASEVEAIFQDILEKILDHGVKYHLKR